MRTNTKGRPTLRRAPQSSLLKGFNFLGCRVYDRYLQLPGECIGLLITGRALVRYDNRPQTVARVAVERLERLNRD